MFFIRNTFFSKIKKQFLKIVEGFSIIINKTRIELKTPQNKKTPITGIFATIQHNYAIIEKSREFYIFTAFHCILHTIKHYLAYSTMRVSRIIVSRILPGYFKSVSIRFAMSLASCFTSLSAIFSLFTRILNSRPA